MFVYKLSVCGFKSCFSHLIFRSCAGLSKELLDIQATSRMQIYSTCTCNMLKAHSQCKYPDPPKTWMKNTKKLEKTKPRKKVWYVSLRERNGCACLDGTGVQSHLQTPIHTILKTHLWYVTCAKHWCGFPNFHDSFIFYIQNYTFYDFLCSFVSPIVLNFLFTFLISYSYLLP